VNKLLNAWPLLIDTDSVRTLLCLAWDEQGVYSPGDVSLFYNGFVMVRVTLPFGVWLHLKPMRNLRFQCGGGWALNGRVKLTFRFQTDESAAAGVSGRNFGQAGGWARGTA
jgi:hypothetical protein